MDPPSGGPNSGGTVTLNFQPSELRENKFRLLKASGWDTLLQWSW
jgi:hypothetical protein